MAIRGVNPYHFLTLASLIVSCFLMSYNIYYLRLLQAQRPSSASITHSSGGGSRRGQLHYTLFTNKPESGYLKHVWTVLERVGYTRVAYNVSNDWSVMWAHPYPFKKIKSVLLNMKPYQKVNKLPGSGFVTNKVDLATSGLPNIPKAFRIPEGKEDLLSYVSENPLKMFVQKNNSHRGVNVLPVEKLDLNKTESFVQEFVKDPLLIDGYKFDIGIYTMITSVEPLRIYVFSGDVLIRFCPKIYHPFDAAIEEKYVVNDNYRPIWNVPTLSKLYVDLGYTFKDTLNIHIQSIGHNPDKIWGKMHGVISNVYKWREEKFATSASEYPYPRAFFELVRFDFVLDSKLDPYLMEANMSPNLSSGHFPQNRLLYEQVLYNLFRLVGVARPGVFHNSLTSTSKQEIEMQVSGKDINVFGQKCVSQQCSRPGFCSDHTCWMCKACLSSDEVDFLQSAYLEHCNRHLARRIYPKPISHKDATEYEEKGSPLPEPDRSISNQKMHQWFVGKCAIDSSWCN